jgi:NAD(P)-dependent dehydrogenase (short-subunit alcohol dehydrogenase family)
MPNLRRSAIVTGSAGALGRAVAVRLARDGWRIALADVDDDGNRATATAVAAAGGEPRCERLDVADAVAWRDLVDRLKADWPQLDLLVNNAGIAAAGRVGEMSLDDWRHVVDVDLWGAVYGCHTCVEWLKQNPAGSHVVNVASFAGFAALPEMAAYNTAKAGVIALSETMRTELAAERVGVTVVCPGFFASGLGRLARMQTQSQRDFMDEAMRNARIAADDIAAAIVEAVARNRPYVVLPARARRFWLLKRLFPEFFLRRVLKLYAARGAANAQS